MNNNNKKICTKCKVEKEITSFSLQRKGVYRSRCNDCKNEDNRLYRLNNKEKDKQTKQNWKENNSNYWNLYYEENKKDIKNYLSEYYQENKDKIINNVKEYYNENKEEILLNRKIYYKKTREENIELFRIKALKNFYQQRLKFPYRFAWRMLLRNTIQRMNTTKSDKTIKMLGYSANDLKLHMESLFTEGMNWNNWGEWHIHHKKFVSHFDFNTPSSVVNALDNLIPLWKEDHKKIHKNND